MAITPGGRPGDASPLGKGKRRLTNYEREVAHALMRHGHSKRDAIRIARGVIDRAAATGRWAGGKAKPNVRAGAAASVAERGALNFSHTVRDELRDMFGRWAVGDHHAVFTKRPGRPGYTRIDRYVVEAKGPTHTTTRSLSSNRRQRVSNETIAFGLKQGTRVPYDPAKGAPKSLDLSTLDFAAQHGHHIAGTQYHWYHGWIPRDVFTAHRFGKDESKLSDYHRLEPEEFNGYNHSPKFVGEADHGGTFTKDAQPKMAYAKNKYLTSNVRLKDKDGTTYTPAKLSKSGTHLLDTEGKKHRLDEAKPMGAGSALALSNLKKQKYAAATKTYHIKSSFGGAPYDPYVTKGKTPKQLLKSGHAPTFHPEWGHGLGGTKMPPEAKPAIYKAPKSYDEPHFPVTSSRTTPNIEGTFTTDEKAALKNYTGSGYAALNSPLRSGSFDPEKKGPYLDRVKALDKAVAKAEPLPKGTYLHRGMNVAAISHLQPGDSFVDPGFASTSRNPNFHMSQRSTRLHIEEMDPKLKALDVNSVSSNPGEAEVLLQRNTKFTVIRRVVHGGHVHLYVKAEPADEAVQAKAAA